jgi:hypothetical protein
VIFITARFKVKAEHAEAWADLTREFRIVSQEVDQDDWSELGEAARRLIVGWEALEHWGDDVARIEPGNVRMTAIGSR